MVRFKNRYVVVEITPENWKDDPKYAFITTSPAIARAIMQKVNELYGDFGSAAIYSGLNIKYCNEFTRIAVIRSRHGPHRFISSSIPFVTFVDKTKVVMKSLYIGATVKHCQFFIKNYQQKKIEKDLIRYKNKPEYEELCQIYKSIYTL